MRILRRNLDSSSAVKCLWRDAAAARGYGAAVSLHSHTAYSRENMDFVPRVMRKVPAATFALRIVERRLGRAKDDAAPYQRIFWRPPLLPHGAYDLECEQIHALGLRPLVSITDHDDIRACADLNSLGIPAPYSTEWTAPFRETIIHLGVHNLPAELAVGFQAEMARYTAAPSEPLLAEILAALTAIDNVLVVFNHPLCCELRLERPRHVRFIQEFLKLHGPHIHALELNGLQPAADNRDVVKLAEAAGLPVISGGDRHCLEPNANVNLTSAASFEEFVGEVRHDRFSRVLFLPQYREPLASRYIQFIWHAVKDYPEQLGRERSFDRIFYTSRAGITRSLAEVWPGGGPLALRGVIAAIGWLAAPPVRATLWRALGDEGEIGA